MTDEFTQWLNDFLGRFSRELQEGTSAQMQKLLAGMVRPEMLQDLLKGIDFEALGRLMGAGAAVRQASPYEILGLPQTATDEDVRRRYRELAKRLHPDVAGPGGAHLFKLVAEAYQRIMRSRGH